MGIITTAVNFVSQQWQHTTALPHQRSEEDQVVINLCRKLLITTQRRADAERELQPRLQMLDDHRVQLESILANTHELDAAIDRIWGERGQKTKVQVDIRREEVESGLRCIESKSKQLKADIQHLRDSEKITTDRLMTRLSLIPELTERNTGRREDDLLDKGTMTSLEAEEMAAECAELAEILEAADPELQGTVKVVTENQGVIRLSEEEYDEWLWAEEVVEMKTRITEMYDDREVLKAKGDLSDEETAQLARLNFEIGELSRHATMRGFPCRDGRFIYQNSSWIDLSKKDPRTYREDEDPFAELDDAMEVSSRSRTAERIDIGSPDILQEKRRASSHVASVSDRAVLNGSQGSQEHKSPFIMSTSAIEAAIPDLEALHGAPLDEATDLDPHTEQSTCSASSDDTGRYAKLREPGPDEVGEDTGRYAELTEPGPEDAVDDEDDTLDEWDLHVRHLQVLAWREEVRKQCEEGQWMVDELETRPDPNP